MDAFPFMGGKIPSRGISMSLCICAVNGMLNFSSRLFTRQKIDGSSLIEDAAGRQRIPQIGEPNGLPVYHELVSFDCGCKDGVRVSHPCLGEYEKDIDYLKYQWKRFLKSAACSTL